MKKVLESFLLAALVLLVLSLGSVFAVENETVQSDLLPYDVALKGQMCSFTNSLQLVMRSEAEWQKYRESAKLRHLTYKVKWDEEMLIAIHLGARNDVRSDIRADEVLLRPNDCMEVVFSELGPGLDPSDDTDLIRPYVVIKTLRVEGKVSFIKSAPGQYVSFLPLYEGDNCDVKKSTGTVLRTKMSFVKYWKSLAIPGNPDTPDDIDFNKFIVIAIHLDEKRTEGYWIKITQITRRNNDGLRVQYSEMSPKRGSDQEEIKTQPFAFFLVPKVEGNVEFIKSSARQ